MASIAALHRYTGRQRGVVTIAQARAAGLTDRQLATAIHTGRLERLTRGVYGLGGAPPDPLRLLVAATLATRGAGSHRSAGHLLGLVDTPPDPPELLLPPGARSELTIAQTYRTRSLPPTDLARVSGIVVTRPVRTLIDLATVATEAVLEEAFNRAVARHRVTPARLAQRLDQLGSAGRAGTGFLRELLGHYAAGTPTDSPLETLLVRAVRSGGLPPPVLQHRVVIDGRVYLLDCAWPLERVFLEGDGLGAHLGRVSLVSDLGRQNRLVVAGWLPLRYPWSVVREQPELVVAQVAAVLAARAPKAS